MCWSKFRGGCMNTQTKQSDHPFYHVFIDENTIGKTILAIDNGNDIWDYWRVDEIGHERISKINNCTIKRYWQDYTTLKAIQNIYIVLDFYVKTRDNIVELDNSFTADDIPF